MANIDQLYREMTRRSLRQAYGAHRWQEGVADSVLGIIDAALRDLDIETKLRKTEGKPIPIRLASMRKELSALKKEMVKAVSDRLAAAGDGAAQNFVELHAKGIQDSLFDTFKVNFSMSRPAPTTLAAIATSRPFQGRVMSEHVAKWGDDFVARATQALQVGMANGRSPQELQAMLRGSRPNVGDPSAVYPVTRREAAVISRTYAQHVHSEARNALYQANLSAISSVMYICTLDERTCLLYCAPRDGLVYKLPDHEPVGHSLPWLGGPGQMHFQCRCTSIAVLRQGFLESLGVDPSRLAKGKRASMDGPVDVASDYSDWLKAQPQDRQDRILGARRAAWWRQSGGTLLQATQRRFGGVPVTPAATLADAFAELPRPPSIATAAQVRDALGGLSKARTAAQGVLQQRGEVLTARVLDGDTAAVLEAAAAFEEAKREAERLAEEIRAELVTVMGRGKELPAKALRVQFASPTAKSKHGDKAEVALDFIASIWGRPLPETVRRIGVVFHSKGAAGRSYLSLADRHIYLADRAGVKSAVHELGHLFDSDEVLLRTLALLSSRTAGESAQWLGAGYAMTERYRPDKFMEKYFGKDYGPLATEILSMGLEHLYVDPIGLMEADPDLFDWLVDLLAGRI